MITLIVTDESDPGDPIRSRLAQPAASIDCNGMDLVGEFGRDGKISRMIGTHDPGYFQSRVAQ